jgi:hypothetical protein
LAARRSGSGLGGGFRGPAFREFFRLMLPRMASVPIDPLTVTYFTAVAAGLGAGSVTSLSFSMDYPDRAGQPDRRVVLAGHLSGAVGRVRRRRRARASGPSSAGTSSRSRCSRRSRGDRPVRAARRRSSTDCSAAASSTPRTSRGPRRSSPRSRSRSRSMPSPTRSRAACTRRTTRSARSWLRSPGWRSWWS